MRRLTDTEVNLAFRRFYGDGKDLGEIASELSCGVFDLSPWLTAAAVRIALDASSKGLHDPVDVVRDDCGGFASEVNRRIEETARDIVAMPWPHDVAATPAETETRTEELRRVLRRFVDPGRVRIVTGAFPDTLPDGTPAYLVRKGGAWYRPNSQGYTRQVTEAGRFTKERAEAEARVDPVSIQVVRLGDALADAGIAVASRKPFIRATSLVTDDAERSDATGPEDEEIFTNLGIGGRRTTLDKHRATSATHIKAVIEHLDGLGLTEAADTLVWSVWHRENGARRHTEQMAFMTGPSTSGRGADHG